VIFPEKVAAVGKDLRLGGAARLEARGSVAEGVTRKTGGVWHGDHGIARCPICEQSNTLRLSDGHTKVQARCLEGCDRRAIVSVLHRRRLLDS
jgi:hypothetical protein